VKIVLMAKVFLVVGLPGSGKSTHARRLAIEHHALRLTPDDWMIPLFGEPEGEGKRDVLEGRFITLALQLVRLGTNMVLDFGFWSREERLSLRWLFERVGA
jgi:predicted kinase